MKRLDDWILEERIGSGGLAEVWRARPVKGGKPVAIKILREPDRSEAHRARFLREGRLLRRLSHPGLPRCYAIGDKRFHYLVLELLQGETLSNRIRNQGPLGPEHVSTMAAALLRVLDYLHQNGIVHRDIKASNVYLADDNRVLLLDLGLAADPADPLTTTLGDVMGTYAYMAPEQIAGAEVDLRCDLYSLGITLYEALAGTRPFHARGAAGYLRAHREAQAPPLGELCPDAPPRLLDTIARLMARDPLARPASAAIGRAMLTGAASEGRSLRPAPIVGRAGPIGSIEAVIDGGGCAILVGEIGSGAGRMASLAIAAGKKRGMETIAIRCRSRSHPRDPVEQLARDLGRISGPVEATDEAVARAAEALSAEGPLLLIVEDVEHCAPEGIAGLDCVIRAAPKMSVVMTGVRAPDELPGHRVSLRQLTLEETLQLVAGMLGTTTPPAGLPSELHRMSGGLPAIIVLAVKDLVARGALWCEGLADDASLMWRLDRNVPLEPTTGLVRLFGNLLAGLPEPSRGLLEVLATVGEAIPLEIAIRLAGSDLSGEALGPLVRAGLATSEDHEHGEWIVLRRPAVAALVLNQVPIDRQRQIHRQLAQELQRLPPGPWRDQRLAWHAAHGASPEDAPTALLVLGEDLFRRGLHLRALDVLDRASKIPGAGTHVAASLAIARGNVLEAAGRRDEATNALSAGRRLAEELGDNELIGRAIVGLALVSQSAGDERRAALLAEDALELLRNRPEDPSLPRALLLAATSHRMGARPEQAAAMFNQCIDVATRQGLREYVAMANGGLGCIFAEEGHQEQALRHLEMEGSWLRANGHNHWLAPNLCNLAGVHRRMGLVARAVQDLDEADDAARFAQLPFLQAQVLVGRAEVLLALGDLRGVDAALRAARVALDSEASTFLRIAYRDVQSHLRLAAGDRQAALAVYQVAEMESSRAGFAALGSFFLGMIGVLTADPEAISEAMDVLGIAGDRRLAARLLLFGATIGGDAEVLDSAERETRASGDRFLLLEVLHASGSAVQQREAREVAAGILENTPVALRPTFLALPQVRWATEG